MIVILNETSGSALTNAERDEALRAAFEKHGLEAEFWRADAGHALAALAQKAAASDHETIVAGGGDGTISSVAAALVNTPKRLGVLPLGTLNHFAKDCGIPVSLQGALQTLASGHERRVDVAEVNGRVFLNNSSLGLYPRMVRHREQQRQRLGRGKWPAFAWAVLSALHVCPSLHLRFEADGTAHDVRTPFLFVGNNAYSMERLRIGARDRLDAGALSIYYASNTGRWGVVALALRSVAGRVEQARNFETLTARDLRVETRARTIDVSVDGEVCAMNPPLHYRIRAQGLRVLAPPPA